MIIADYEIECSDCGEIVTPAEMKDDTCRMMKLRDGTFLCELCYEDYCEYMEVDDDY